MTETDISEESKKAYVPQLEPEEESDGESN